MNRKKWMKNEKLMAPQSKGGQKFKKNLLNTTKAGF
jgi:hypothetical protein